VSGRPRRELYSGFCECTCPNLFYVSTSLLDSLKESFGEPELLSVKEGNGWRPEKGADKVDAHKGSSLIAQGLPPILQFHLKRFTYDWQADSMDKVNSRLAFPSELDLSTICKPADDEDVTYDLQSIVIHMGRFGVGHYYSYVRPDLCSNTWYRFNDDIVEEVTEEEVFEDAYGGEGVRKSSQQGKRGIPVLGRLLRRLGMQSGVSHGYGGSTSNAYVVQYVRRSDRRKLYLE
jgi:ubiquitin C-terminal hydrolase